MKASGNSGRALFGSKNGSKKRRSRRKVQRI